MPLLQGVVASRKYGDANGNPCGQKKFYICNKVPNFRVVIQCAIEQAVATGKKKTAEHPPFPLEIPNRQWIPKYYVIKLRGI